MDASQKKKSLPLDITAEEITGVQIGQLGHKLWVCVDGQCVLRVKSPKIELDDQRKINECLTATEAAKMIGVSINVFRNLVNRKHIKGVVQNGVTVYPREQFDE
jgi:hypothetical protein